MEFTDKDLFDRAVSFLEECKDTRTHIIHDFDVDGISGGLLLLHTLDRLGADVTASTRAARGAPLHKTELERIRDEIAPERIIITDQDPKGYGLYEQFRSIFPDADLLIIDHHKPAAYDDALFVHPELVYGVRGDKYCSAKLVYDICEAATDVEDLSWLAAAGILGDANARYFPDFLANVCEYHDEEVPEDFFDASFATIADAIDCTSAAGEEELLAYVELLKDQPTLEGAVALGNPAQYIRDEVDEWVDRAKLLAERDGPVVWLFVESEHSINSWVATIVSFEYPHRVFASVREQVDGYSVSLRFQDATIHLGEIISDVSSRFGGKGGGHAPAAGGYIPSENWDAFRQAFDERVQEEIEKLQ